MSPTSPVAILPLTGSKPETSPPHRSATTSGHVTECQKRPTIFGKTSHPAFAGGAEWCYLDMWISTRGVEGLHQKVDDRKRFRGQSCANFGKKSTGRSAPLSKRCETRILATRPRHRFQEVLYIKRLYTEKGPRQRKDRVAKIIFETV